MADADYFLDMSSPDPLAEEDAPTSVRPASSRRITRSKQDFSSVPLPLSSPQRGPRAQSPRKRTFQLDVGDEQSPQRIRVTVEADEALHNSIVNRKLFPPPASPTRRKSRSPRRRETITTTIIPLNDEDDLLGDEVATTPRQRGRRRRISNGTPLPRGRKRAGTPIERGSKQARQDDGLSSEIGVLDDISTTIANQDAGKTPKSKTTTRKTPKKTSITASAPSSQISNRTTGRKRGRPRKVPLNEEPIIPEPDTQRTSGTSLRARRDESLGKDIDGDAHAAPGPSPEQGVGAASQLYNSSPQNPASMGGSSGSPTSSHQDMVEYDEPMGDADGQGVDMQSDDEPAENEDGMTRDGQDTIADASDFSMIALESLPSFQASFQASFYADTGQPASDEHEMGEETSRIISQTLDSLRRSMQDEGQSSPNAGETQSDVRSVGDGARYADKTLNQSTSSLRRSMSGRPLEKSPRRPKQLPLSRQVFVGRGNVDDSFSSIPDSLLQAASPGHLPQKPATEGHEPYNKEGGNYEDSFSEIPEAVLEAATPRPARRAVNVPIVSPSRHEEPRQTSHPIDRRPSLENGSADRLPTQEDTASSNEGSKKPHEGEAGPEIEAGNQPNPLPRTDVASSPPARTRPRALDFGYSNLQHELNAVQEKRSASPQRQLSSKPTSGKMQTLEAPLSAARPSLSPIVRAGRTLQNVMSDNSSPEGRERNLGSPFRGSASSDRNRQSSTVRSPSPSIRIRGASNRPQPAIRSPPRLNPDLEPNMVRKYGRGPRNPDEVRGTHIQDGFARPKADLSLNSAQNRPPYTLTAGSTALNPLNEEEENARRRSHDNSSEHNNGQPQPIQTASSSNQRTARIQNESAFSRTTTSNVDSAPRREQKPDTPPRDVSEDPDDGLEQGNSDGGSDDDMDIWDIEASRTSPGQQEPTQTISKPQKSDASQRRRSRVPSPWRRNNRRLIYKDDFASSSQIEIEETSQSPPDPPPPTRSSQRPVPQPEIQPQQNNEEQVLRPETDHQDLMQEETHEKEDVESLSSSYDDLGDYAESVDSGEQDVLPEDEELNPPEQSQAAHLMDEHPEEQVEHEVEEEPEDVNMTAAPEPSSDIAEYSMVDQSTETPNVKEKTAPAKSGFFGGFNIASFFSSPAILPTNKSPGSDPSGSVRNEVPFQAALNARQPKEPPKAMWSTGLFPSIPQNEPRPNPQRPVQDYSPEPNLHSTDTVADTYEPSVSTSPPSQPPSKPIAPPTPERHVLPIPEQNPEPALPVEDLRHPPLEPSQEDPEISPSDFDFDDQDSSDQEESAAVMERFEYERVPPREKLSQWDRNLSPVKSSFRSPLKPTTPGRVVTFTNPELSPSVPAQDQARTQAQSALRNMINAYNAIPQVPPPRPTLEGKENQQHSFIQQESRDAQRVNQPNGVVPKPAMAASVMNQPRPLRPAMVKSAATATANTTPSSSSRLSPTIWTSQHWTRLDGMLRLRRLDPTRFQRMCATYAPHREHERSSTRLLGGEVSAQNARLVLEPWHLDVVDAFRLEVGAGCWDERVIAKRVFAIVVGWERRRRRHAAATTAVAAARASASASSAATITK